MGCKSSFGRKKECIDYKTILSYGDSNCVVLSHLNEVFQPTKNTQEFFEWRCNYTEV